MKALNPSKRSRIALIALCLAVSVLVPCLLSQTAMAAGGSCPDYLFIGARGSGQTYQRTKAGDYGVGSTVYSFYQYLTDDLYGSGLDIELDPVPEPPYEANSVASKVTDAAAFFHLPGSYEDSVKTIEPWVTNEVETRLAACPGTKVILSGYSQGAQGVADALQRDINPSVVIGAAFFGDPYFNPKSPGDRGSFDSERVGILGVRPQYGGSLAHKVFSYCRDKDPICQGFIRYSTIVHTTSWDTSQHEKYATEGDPNETDTEMAADNVAALIRDDQASDGNVIDEPSPGPLSGPLDVAFAIDSTGSMGWIIDSVKANIASLAEQLDEADPDFRVALVDYKDAEPYSYGDPYQAQVDQTFTTNLSDFDSAVSALYASGGGDTPESVYTGMMTALNLPWRTGAHKELVVIGDAGGHPVDPITGYTADDVVAKALALDPVAVNAIPATTEADETFGPVAERTGGANVPVEGDAAEAITQTIQTTQTAPTASLGIEDYEGYEDLPIVFDAGGSMSPLGRPLTYEWDFDNDGHVDETTDTPVVEHTFTGGYDGLVTLTVTDNHGQSAVAQAHVKASGKAPQAPGTPGIPQMTSGDGSVTATWSPPVGGGPVNLYLLTDAEGVPEGVVSPSGSGVQSETVEGLTNGEPIQLAVTAINGAGAASSELSAAATPEARAVEMPKSSPGKSSPPAAPSPTPALGSRCKKGYTKKTTHGSSRCIKKKRRPLRCRKGLKKQRLHGKVRCVKVKSRGGKRHGHKSS
jgi:PKD repeat protein